MSESATLKTRVSAGVLRWKLPRTTGTSWTDCGCFCWCCFILGSELAQGTGAQDDSISINFRGSSLRFREVSRFVAERSINRLQMQRNWIVDRVSDFSVGKEFLKLISTLRPDGVLMENVFLACGNLRRLDRGYAT